MNPTRLRAIVKRYGTPGLLLVAGLITLHSLWHRRRLRYGLLLPALCFGALWLATSLIEPQAEYVETSLAASNEPAASYKITDLGTLKGGPTSAEALSDNGYVADYSQTGRQTLRGYAWHRGKMTDVGTLGGSVSIATGVNNEGQVVGLSYLRGDEAIGAFVWQNGRLTDVGNLGQPFTFVGGINDRGVVVGASADGEFNIRPFAWKGGRMKVLPTPAEFPHGYAAAINNDGVAAGQVFGESEEVKAAVWSGDKAQVLPGIGGNFAVVNALSNRLQAVGVAGIKPGDQGPFHATLWQRSGVADLGTLDGFENSTALGVNDREQIVGACFGRGKNPVAFVWQSGRMVNLNGKLPRNSGWTLLVARDINNRGDICGYGIKGGELRAFLMTAE